MKIYFRAPHPEDDNFEVDLPQVPRIGESVQTIKHVYRVVDVVWFTNPEEGDTNPYVILHRE